ncbi:MAG: heavy metal translocating P-type ATPase [Candidatus Dojkabacteria bacterium]
MKNFAFKSDVFILVLLIFALIFSVTNAFQPQNQENISLVINIIAIIPVFISTIKAIKNRKITVDLLASVALLLALANKEYFSSLFINLMLTTARIVDGYTEKKTEDSIKSLLDLKPEKVRIKTKDGIQTIRIEAIRQGDIVMVNLGERVPIDGKIVNGHASLDLSSLTGESLPVERKEGEEVLSSSLITSGDIEVRAERVGKDTALEKIIQLVSESVENKPEITQRADIFAKWYIIIISIVTVILYLITRNLNFILSIILVVCADDIAVAIPLAFIGGTRAASRLGIVIKGGKYLEAMSEIKTLVVDKTGTLTTGKLKVNEVFSKEDNILQIVYAITEGSTHPVAKAIAEYAKLEKTKYKQPKDLEEIEGHGITAVVNGVTYFLGKKDFVEKKVRVINKAYTDFISEQEDKGFNVSVISDTKKVVGVISLSDRVKSDTQKVVRELDALGVKKIVMLTGDNEKIAKTVSLESGIKEYHANFLPADKQKFVKKLLNSKSKTAMIGDGVNDAASLSLADIGISMGAIGSDSAIDASDVILIDDKLSKIPKAIELSRFILNISKQDYAIWIIVNIIGLGLVFGGVLNPSGAAFYNFITDFIPLFNSLRAFFWKGKKL